jgi:hypothetical protein
MVTCPKVALRAVRPAQEHCEVQPWDGISQTTNTRFHEGKWSNCSKQTVLKASSGERWNLHRNKVGL